MTGSSGLRLTHSTETIVKFAVSQVAITCYHFIQNTLK